MRRRNNKNNDNHILTLNERFFYQRLAIDGTQRIIDECWKIVNNPAQEDQERKLTALHIALEGQVQLCDMLKMIREQYYPAATTDHNNDYDYGR